MTQATRIKGIAVWVILVMCLCMVFTIMSTSRIALAESTTDFDGTNVLDDLRSSTVDGEPFDLRDYPYRDNGTIQIINFVEYCYSYKASKRDQYGLYVYIYNPANINIDTRTQQNKIQMAVAYGADGTPTRYEKFDLVYCSKAEETEYRKLFYKFRIEDKEINGKTFADRVNSTERRYDVSGVEILTYGNQTATEYVVGGTYKFSGYSKGYGADTNSESTLACIVENVETLKLDVHHTGYRTNVSSLGADHYNEVNTVYFSVPAWVFEDYGYLQKIRAQWWEYKMAPALVTSNESFKNAFINCVDKNTGDYNSNIPAYLYSDFTFFSHTSDGIFPQTTTVYEYQWAYNIMERRETGFGYTDTTRVINREDMIPYVFYSPAANDIDGVFDFLIAKQNVGDVTSNEVSDWIYSYTNDLGNGYIDCNGRPISNDLFEGYVDEGRTMGANDTTIDLSETFDLLSYDSNHNWWDKLWTYGFSWPQTNGDYYNVPPIYELKAEDLVGTPDSISSNLLVNSNDVVDLQTYYAAETIKGNKVILFRFANTDYFCKNVAGGLRDGSGLSFDEDDKVAYIAQETVFLDFDIIELTFNKEGVYHVIPVVSSPMDIINGITAPADQFQWWKVLLGVLLLVILLIILAPILPFIIQALFWLICLPFKLIGKLITKIRQKADRPPKEKTK